MNYTKLNEARAKVQAARDAIAKDNEALQQVQNEVVLLQARIKKLEQRQEEKGLRASLALAVEALAQTEEAALDEHCLELASEIVKRQASDPLRHSAWIMTNLNRLRDSVRSEFNTPLTIKYSVHPLITQALALLPPRDDTRLPVYDLGHQMHGHTDWASRRRSSRGRGAAASATRYSARSRPP
jgi:hypothetical protein